MKKKLILIMVLLCIAMIGSISAQNMTISDLGYGNPQTIQIYVANGTLLGTYNTSENGIILPPQDFQLIIKPETSTPLSDPGAFLTNGLSFVQTNAIPLILLMFCIGLVFRGLRIL